MTTEQEQLAADIANWTIETEDACDRVYALRGTQHVADEEHAVWARDELFKRCPMRCAWRELPVSVRNRADTIVAEHRRSFPRKAVRS